MIRAGRRTYRDEGTFEECADDGGGRGPSEEGMDEGTEETKRSDGRSGSTPTKKRKKLVEKKTKRRWRDGGTEE